MARNTGYTRWTLQGLSGRKAGNLKEVGLRWINGGRKDRGFGWGKISGASQICACRVWKAASSEAPFCLRVHMDGGGIFLWARQETAPFCLQVHLPDEAPNYEIDKGQPLARLSTSVF